MSLKSRSPGHKVRQKFMSKFFEPPGGILTGLINSGLVENYGIPQKNPRRVAASLRHHARARKARREAKEALSPPIAPRRHLQPGPKPIGTRMYDPVLRVMSPGNWYARGDLARAVGVGLDARGHLVRSLLANALATRTRNPEAASGTPTRPEPQWLYRLTAKGEALRALCNLLT
jgi:hypothetical protein